MGIIPYDRKYRKEMFRLWNCAGVREGYVPLTEDEWECVLPGNPCFSGRHTFLLEEKGDIGGCICGTVPETQSGKRQGYISCLLLSDEMDTPDCTVQLLTELETSFREEGLTESVWSFRSPIHLPWTIPGTENGGYPAKDQEPPYAACARIHNNAPGVPCDRPIYRRMKEYGYCTLVKQSALYLDLETFSVPARKWELEKKAGKRGYRIEWYDKSRHVGLITMVESLGNPQWSQEIPEAAEKMNMLVAVKEDAVVGFAGPVYPESTGRGYFAGIAVDAAHGRHGLGTLLFYRLCEEEKKCGAIYLSFFTGEESYARKIYEGAGATVRRSFAVMVEKLQKG